MKLADDVTPPVVEDSPVQVWLVDDNTQLRTLIAEALERAGRISCTRQFDCPNGLISTLASRQGPDVILLDVQMGELNGLDALPSIKSLSPNTRVFMLTTFFDLTWKTRAMDNGASGYYLKWDAMDQLVLSIRDRSSEGKPVRRRPRRFKRAASEPAAAAVPEASSRLVPDNAVPNGRRGALLGWFRRLARN